MIQIMEICNTRKFHGKTKFKRSLSMDKTSTTLQFVANEGNYKYQKKNRKWAPSPISKRKIHIYKQRGKKKLHFDFREIQFPFPSIFQ